MCVFAGKSMFAVLDAIFVSAEYVGEPDAVGVVQGGYCAALPALWRCCIRQPEKHAAF